MSRLETIFAALRREGRPGLVTFTTAGDPDLPTSAAILRALDGAGADVLEVGVPFSDPLADGPVIQRASERALAAGATLGRTLDLVAEVRSSVEAGIVLFTYANPVVRMGLETFAGRAAAAGVDGVLVLDLPIEEADGLRAAVDGTGIDPIFLLSPTTTDARIRRAAALGRGFLYGISRLGVTGARDTIADGAEALIARIRAATTLPVALGFGISRPEHVAAVTRWADAAVVGSALVEVVAGAARDEAAPAAARYIRWLRGADDAPEAMGGPAAAGERQGSRRLRGSRRERTMGADDRTADTGAPAVVDPDDIAARLNDFRGRIDRLDVEIVRLLNARAACANEIGWLKGRAGMEIYEPAREQAVLEHVRQANPGPLGGDAVARVFERIIDESRRLERMTTEGRER